MTLANIRLYSAIIPPPPTIDDTKKGKDDDAKKNALNGDDPGNRNAVNKAIFEFDEED